MIGESCVRNYYGLVKARISKIGCVFVIRSWKIYKDFLGVFMDLNLVVENIFRLRKRVLRLK